MTDRLNAFIVILERDIREDDAEATLHAIRHIRGVTFSTPRVADMTTSIAEARVKQELTEKLWKVLFDKSDE